MTIAQHLPGTCHSTTCFEAIFLRAIATGQGHSYLRAPLTRLPAGSSFLPQPLPLSLAAIMDPSFADLNQQGKNADTEQARQHHVRTAGEESHDVLARRQHEREQRRCDQRPQLSTAFERQRRQQPGEDMPIIAAPSKASIIAARAPIPAAASPAPPATTRRRRSYGIIAACSEAVDRSVDEFVDGLWRGLLAGLW